MCNVSRVTQKAQREALIQPIVTLPMGEALKLIFSV
uniref:Uncharacterized protein n=1 Tax=Rhizophora mucronata TaxID=61149 RepID=A0A2P2ITR2_RHIMU